MGTCTIRIIEPLTCLKMVAPQALPVLAAVGLPPPSPATVSRLSRPNPHTDNLVDAANFIAPAAYVRLMCDELLYHRWV